jgi:hypothetical protein
MTVERPRASAAPCVAADDTVQRRSVASALLLLDDAFQNKWLTSPPRPTRFAKESLATISNADRSWHKFGS